VREPRDVVREGIGINDATTKPVHGAGRERGNAIEQVIHMQASDCE